MTPRLANDDNLVERLKRFDPEALAELYRARDNDARLQATCDRWAVGWLESQRPKRKTKVIRMPQR